MLKAAKKLFKKIKKYVAVVQKFFLTSPLIAISLVTVTGIIVFTLTLTVPKKLTSIILQEDPAQTDAPLTTISPFALTSTAFTDNRSIPSKYTCDGQNISPDLAWEGTPSGTKSFALIVNDPDAQGWTHWLVFNIPATTSQLPENVDDKNLIYGTTSFTTKDGVAQKNYGGPCPPSGTHHYHFTLYALDSILNLNVDAHETDVMHAMQGHILGTTKLVGLYERIKK